MEQTIEEVFQDDSNLESCLNTAIKTVIEPVLDQIGEGPEVDGLIQQLTAYHNTVPLITLVMAEPYGGLGEVFTAVFSGGASTENEDLKAFAEDSGITGIVSEIVFSVYNPNSSKTGKVYEVGTLNGLFKALVLSFIGFATDIARKG